MSFEYEKVIFLLLLDLFYVLAIKKNEKFQRRYLISCNKLKNIYKTNHC